MPAGVAGVSSVASPPLSPFVNDVRTLYRAPPVERARPAITTSPAADPRSSATCLESDAPPDQPSPRSRVEADAAPASRSSCAWASGCGSSGWSACCSAAGSFVFLYQTTDIPDPNEDFQTQTSFVYYADGKTELGQFATPEPHSHPARRDAADAPGRGGRRREPDVLDRQGHRPEGHPARGVQQRRGQRHPGRVDDHPAVRQDPLPHPGAHARPARSRRRSSRSSCSGSMSKNEILQGYLNTIYFGRGAYGIQAAAQAYFDVNAKDLNLRQGAVLASVLNNPTGLRPGQRQGRRRRTSGALPVRPRRDGRRPAPSPPRRPSRPQQQAAEVPEDRGREPTYGGQKGHMLTLVRDELHRLGFKDEEIDGGGLRVTTTFTKKAMDAAEDGRARGQARGLLRQAAARRRRHGRARHRRARGLLRRPGLPRRPRSTGPSPAAWSARRSSRSRWRRRSRTATPSRTPSRATRRTSSPTAATVSNEGAGDGGNDYGVRSARRTRSSSRSTPRSST